MRNKTLRMISRLFRKNPNNALVSDLYSKMTQPLFVHPEIGEAVMRGYLEASSNMIEPMSMNGDDSGFVTKSENFAVIDIAGALTARQENAPCSMPPASYEVIKQDMQSLLDDPEVSTIIGRFDSPGGMASQNMDLSDFIYASRGQGTKMIAMVDDMAYSAAFGIASAFDEIWVTRTSGVGSVGVVSYHVDQSEANKRAGIKVEYIYAGDKKVLGNPHEELSDEARGMYQTEVSRLYNIFTATVARNLGISVDAVKDTEAGTFHGQDAIDAGFAHKMGTFDELLTSLLSEQSNVNKGAKMTSQEALDAKVTAIQSANESGTTEAEQSNEVDETLEDNAAQSEPDEPVEDVDQSGLSAQDRADLDEKVAELESKQQEVEKELVKYTATIKALCTAAGVPEAAADFITAKMEVDEVQVNLLKLTASPESNISNSSSVSLQQTRADVKAGWKKAFKKAEHF